MNKIQCFSEEALLLKKGIISKAEYTTNKEYESVLRQKVEAFRVGSGCKKAIHMTMITTYGLTDNSYAQTVQNCITMDNLFLS